MWRCCTTKLSGVKYTLLWFLQCFGGTFPKDAHIKLSSRVVLLGDSGIFKRKRLSRVLGLFVGCAPVIYEKVFVHFYLVSQVRITTVANHHQWDICWWLEIPNYQQNEVFPL